MTTRRSFRIVAASLCFAVVITGTYSPSKYVTPRAHAFLGVGDIVFEPVLDVINQVLNGLAWTVAKVAVQSITRSTVNWINSGFQGSPAFVTDLNRNLANLSDAVADQFFDSLDQTVELNTGFNLRAPFQDQLNQKLREEYYRQTSGLLGISQYDLYRYSNNPQAFLGGDFSRGGFDAFFATNGNPANNPFAAWNLYNDRLAAQRSAAQRQREAELQWGKGFLSSRGVCAQASKNTTTALQSGDLNAIGQAVDLNRKENCVGGPVKTPGSVIESQLELSLGSGIRQLELADSINEVVGALAAQLVNQVLGPGGLIGASQPSAGGGRSYLDRATSPSQYDGATSSLSNGVIQSLNNDERSFENMRTQWETILTAANGAQSRCGARPEITNTINRANTQISKANTAQQGVASIRTKIQTAQQSTSGNQSTQIITAVTEYQSYLSSPLTPTPAEIAEAVNESSDTSDSGGVDSLYTRMASLQKNCNS